jgi:hypothetical protein
MNPASPPPDKGGQPCPIRVEYMQKGYGHDIRDTLELNIDSTTSNQTKCVAVAPRKATNP